MMNDEGMAPEGVYQGRVIGWGVGATEKKETPYFGVEVSVEKVENQANGEMEEIEPFNRKLFLWLSPRAVKMTLRSLKNIGYEPEEGKELEPLFMEPDEEGAPDFFDKEVTLQMTHDEYNGQARERWEFFEAPSHGQLRWISWLNSRKLRRSGVRKRLRRWSERSL